jgi:hypothetical protein
MRMFAGSKWLCIYRFQSLDFANTVMKLPVFMKGGKFLEQLSRYLSTFQVRLRTSGWVVCYIVFCSWHCCLPCVQNVSVTNSVEIHKQVQSRTHPWVREKVIQKCPPFVGAQNVCVIHSSYVRCCVGRLREMDGCPAEFGCRLQREGERGWNYQSANITVLQQMMPTC